MRRIFDAHTHIMPLYNVGRRDPAVNAEYKAYGKVVYSGQYVFRAMPDIVADSRFPMESLIEVMDNAGVERAVIQQTESKRMNVEILSAVEEYPGRLKGAVTVRPNEPGCVEELRLYASLGLSVIKLITAEAMGIKGAYSALHFDQEPFLGVWRTAQELKMSVAVDPGAVGNPGYRAEEWRRVARMFPDLHIIFCHMAFPDPDLTVKGKELYRYVLDTLKLPNVWMDLAAVQTFNKSEMYPYPWAVSAVRRVMDECGPEKLLWATDIPSTLVDCTYRQMIGIYECSEAVTEEEKDMLFFKNACRAYRWPE